MSTSKKKVRTEVSDTKDSTDDEVVVEAEEKVSTYHTSTHLMVRPPAGVVTSEYKVFDTYAALASLATPASIICVNQIAQGTDFDQRLGRQLRMKSFHFNFFLTPPHATLEDGVTIWILIDLESMGSSPGLTDVVDTTFIANPFLAYRNLYQFGQRFVVLKCWRSGVIGLCAASGGGNAEAEATPWHGDWTIPIPKKYQAVRYASAAAGTPLSNSLLLVFVGRQGGGAAGAYIEWGARLHFCDD